ncbi:MAG: DUF6270 domain-containing protein [Sphingobium sp.]|uniref:DUF6270 domain-containing protein n=1 Tax=Sphingobium sp. TaxID=1912891 RepID=UPI002E1FF331
MNIAYVGSCYSEEFIKHVLDDAVPRLRFFRVNSVSLMDEQTVDLADMSELTPESRRHLSFENRKNFRQRMREAAPDLLVVDFIRDIRCALLTDGEGFLSFPYELIVEPRTTRAAFLNRLELIPFGSPDYVRLHRQALNRFCNFMNEVMPDCRVLVLNFKPAWDYRGRARTHIDFRADFMAWSARAPMQDLMGRYCAERIKAATLLDYDGPLWSDDQSKYGPASVHYAAACWRLMARRFDRESLSFTPAEPPTAVELGTRLRASFDAFGEEAEVLGDGRWRRLTRSGADVLTELVPVLIQEMLHCHGFKREPTIIDAYNAFLWLLGRPPEGIETLMAHAALPNLDALRHWLMTSEEFQAGCRVMLERPSIRDQPAG